MGSTGMPRLAFGPDPLFNDIAESELYQTYKPKSLQASGWGGTPEAAMAIGQNFLEGLSRGRAQSRAESERDKANKLNALRSERDRIAGDKTLEESARSARLGEMDAKINEVGVTSTERPRPAEPAHGALGHVGRFFSEAVNRVAGRGGQDVSLGTADSGKPWLEDFQARVADPNATQRVPTPEEAAALYEEGMNEARAAAKAANDPNVGNYILGNKKITRAMPHLPAPLQQMIAARTPVSPPASMGEVREENTANALGTAPEERTSEQNRYARAAIYGGKAIGPTRSVIAGFTGQDGKTQYHLVNQDTITGRLTDPKTKEPLAAGWLPAGERGAPFGAQAMPTASGIKLLEPMTGRVSDTGFGVYFDPAMAAYHNRMGTVAGWQMHQLQNQEKANAFLEDVRAYTGGNPLLMDKEIKRRVDLRLIDPMVAGYARTLWGTQDFTRARTGATEAGGALNEEKAAQTKAVTGFFTTPGRESAPQAQQDHRPASVSGGAAEYNNLIGGHAQQYSAPNTPVSPRTGVPIAAPQSAPPDAVAAYQKLLSGFRARGTNPSDIYNSHFSQASAGSAPASFYNSLY